MKARRKMKREIKTNYIVCHYLNGKLIGRWDFGKDFAPAMRHVEYIVDSSCQKGHHQVIALEENRPLSNRNYSESIII